MSPRSSLSMDNVLQDHVRGSQKCGMYEIFHLDKGRGVGCLWWIQDPQAQTIKLDLFPFGSLNHKGVTKKKVPGPQFPYQRPWKSGGTFCGSLILKGASEMTWWNETLSRNPQLVTLRSLDLFGNFLIFTKISVLTPDIEGSTIHSDPGTLWTQHYFERVLERRWPCLAI